MGRALNILVVDDEISFARMLRRALRKLGHKVTIAADPGDALALFAEACFDAVITDIDMPGMSGIELARTLRAQRADLPIAFCTGSDPSDSRAGEARSLGSVMGKVWRDDEVRRLLAGLAGG